MKYIRLRSLATICLALLFMGGCSAHMEPVGSVKPADESVVKDNEELVMQEVESSENLQQELEALSKTGD